VSIDNTSYVVDIGIGPNGPLAPLPLVHDKPRTDVLMSQRRMIYDTVPGMTLPSQKMWRMQLRESRTGPWLDIYCFSEIAWPLADFQIIPGGFYSLPRRPGWFFTHMACFRVLMENGQPFGWILAFDDELKRNCRGRVEVIQKFHNDHDRVVALKKHFGVELTDEEEKLIIGTCTELKERESRL
jgi:arylamine N-acetyltransferase